ncbi:DUF3786 domain-containing protein [Candidatus Omnitrophota bacterium]
MGYKVALDKAWEDSIGLGLKSVEQVKFLADEYSVDPEARQVLSLSCNALAKEYSAILILHYLAQKLKGLPALTNQWASFKELFRIEGYAAAFRKRSIEPIIRKYGSNPQGLLDVLDRLPAKRVDQADIGIIIEVFTGVPALVELWRGDEEFAAEANILFDKNINKIFNAEDLAVLASFIASQL